MAEETKLPRSIEKNLKGFERLINHFEDLKKAKTKLNSFESFRKGTKTNKAVRIIHTNRKQLELINVN